MGSKVKTITDSVGGSALGSVVGGSVGGGLGGLFGASGGGSVKKLGGRILEGVGLKTPDEAFGSELGSVQAMLAAAANNPEGIATQQYKKMSNEGLGKVLATIASQRSLAPSEQANLASRVNRDMQQDVASQAGVMGLEEQMMNRNALANFLLGRSGAVNSMNNAANQRLTGLIGTGMSAAGSMFGGGGKV